MESVSEMIFVIKNFHGIFLPEATFLQHFYALNAYLCGA